jgi:colanic acid/amylovoran biosynthesis glycosyltransferase
MENHLRVLETFDTYLPGTQNWVFQLISNLPNIDVVIAAKSFLKCNFYASNFDYLEFPLKMIDVSRNTLTLRIFNALVSKALGTVYHSYVTKYAGTIDVIHSHFAPVGWEYLNVAKKLKKPHIVSFYGFDYEHLPFVDSRWKKRYERLFREVDLFLCEGSFGARALQKNGCPKDKIAVQRLGVDVDSTPFFAREKTPGELNLLQVASVRGKKGHIYTIKSFVEALESCPNMRLTFVGTDDEGLKGEIETVIHQCHVENKVTFLDWIDFGSLHAFMQDFHVFIQPSCYTATRDCEGGAPIVLLDAQATGMPVIATTHCDIPDEVIHNETGLLTAERDIEGLVDSIRYFYELDANEYRAFSVNARQHVSNNFDCKKNALKLKKIYDKCVEKR